MNIAGRVNCSVHNRVSLEHTHLCVCGNAFSLRQTIWLIETKIFTVWHCLGSLLTPGVDHGE